jgi:hypothetical protein
LHSGNDAAEDPQEQIAKAQGPATRGRRLVQLKLLVMCVILQAWLGLGIRRGQKTKSGLESRKYGFA